MKTLSQSNSNNPTRQNYVLHLQKLNSFFQTKSDIENKLDEFFNVQIIFHQKMRAISQAFGGIKYQSLEEFLRPYQGLQSPIFGEDKKNISKNILHIVQIINPNNKQFQNMLEAILNASANYMEFRGLVLAIESNTILFNQIKTNGKFDDVNAIETHLIAPIQSVTRHILFLKEIQNDLRKFQLSSNISYEKEMESLNSALDFLKQTLKKINLKTEPISYLNKVDRTLGNFLADILNKTHSKELITLTEDLCKFIRVLKERIIHHDENLKDSLPDLVQGLELIEKTYLAPPPKPTWYELAKNTVSASITATTYLVTLPYTIFAGAQAENLEQQLISFFNLQALIPELKGNSNLARPN